MNISRIVLGLILIVGAGGALISGTTAFFSDTETSSGNTFTAGEIDLTIDNESYYLGVFNDATSWTLTNLNETHKFFNFLDLKPGDYGEDTISIHVETNDAYLCANVTLTSNDDNGINDPEDDAGDTTDGPGNGELAGQVNFAWWADDGDNVFEDDEELLHPIGPIGALTLNVPFSLALADSDENIWDGTGPIEPNSSYFIGKAWCFGEMIAAPLPSSGYSGPADDNNNDTEAGTPEDGGFMCSGAGVSNVAQTDSLTADISFEAVQARNNPNFQCEVPEVFEQCENPTLAYADEVTSSSQGVRKNGTSVLAARSNPAAALGAPQSSGNPFDNPTPAENTFFSLGFKNAGATPGGEIVVEFTDNVIVDGIGNDLKVWEVTGGTSYPEEFVRVEVSQNGTDWFVAAASLSRDAEVDLADAGLAWAKYVRLTDVSPIGPFEPTADAYDLDALQALNCGVPIQ
ncbi:MAG TPA: SipW-dependent-type signal peptide-containing protein [Candidatus Paceibacterota bacterium]|nr:SipW-dependent-type signal peptide-containing protein [Candidatus Paceibacterota bacterium]